MEGGIGERVAGAGEAWLPPPLAPGAPGPSAERNPARPAWHIRSPGSRLTTNACRPQAPGLPTRSDSHSTTLPVAATAITFWRKASLPGPSLRRRCRRDAGQGEYAPHVLTEKFQEANQHPHRARRRTLGDRTTISLNRFSRAGCDLFAAQAVNEIFFLTPVHHREDHGVAAVRARRLPERQGALWL